MTKLTTILLKSTLAVGFSLLTAEVSLAQEIIDAGTPHRSAASGPFSNPSNIDPFTQRSQMHACPPNWYMSGVHVGYNWFLCVSFTDTNTGQAITYTPGYEANSDEQVDSSRGANTLNMGAHACPTGTVMSGYRHDEDNLLCVPSPFGSNSVRTRETGNRASMLACEFGEVAAGINADRNFLVCERQTLAVLRPGGGLRDRRAK
jgi:hypothetical protein